MVVEDEDSVESLTSINRHIAIQKIIYKDLCRINRFQGIKAPATSMEQIFEDVENDRHE